MIFLLNGTEYFAPKSVSIDGVTRLANVDGGGGTFGSSGGFLGSSGGVGISTPTYSTSVSAPIGIPDLSPSSVQQAISQGNTYADIKSAYQTYLTGYDPGRGYQYALSAKKKYGYASIQDAAAAYLQAAGISFLAPVTPAPSSQSLATSTTTSTDTSSTTNTTPTKNPFQILADTLPQLFGQATYNPPLQSQAYGYTPVSSGVGGSNLGLFIILGVVAIIIYFAFVRK